MENVINRAQPGIDRRWWYAAPFVAALALIGVLYWETFRIWWWLWSEPGSFYAHAWFVPFFVGVMIWRNRERLAQARWKPSWIGLALQIPAALLLLIARDSDIRVLQSLSFVLLIIGSAFLMIGPPKARLMLFPLLFLLTMIPLLPDQIINVIAFPIQMLSTKMAAFFLGLLQLNPTREGTLIWMNKPHGYRMSVEGACSGFRTLISLLTFAAAFAYLIEAALWKRWLLFFTTIPLSLLINGIRITLIGIVGDILGSKAAETFHDYSGFIVLIIAFAFLFYFAQMLRCERFLGIPLTENPDKKEEETPADTGPTWWQTLLAWRPSESQMRRVLPFILVTDGVLAATVGLNGRVFVKDKPQPPIGTTQVPMRFTYDDITYATEQNPEFDKLPKSIQDQLNPTRLLNRNYNGTDGSRLGFFATAGNARWTFHDPHYCSLGSNAFLHDVGVTTIETKHGPLRMWEANFQYQGMKDTYVMMYCYVVGDTILQRTDEMHKALLMQTIFGNSGKPSYFLRFTQRLAGTDEQKRKELRQFAAAMWEEVGPILQGKQPAIYEPPPVPAEK